MSDFVQNLGTVLKPFASQPAEKPSYRKYQENRDNSKERKKQNSDKEPPEKTENTAVISVKAVILYLEDLLEAKLNSKFKQTGTQKPQSAIQPWLKQDHSNQNQQAAQAYRAASISSRNRQVTKAKQQQEHHELKEIYYILKKLRSLKDRGILTITVSQQERFIDSIWHAVHSEDQPIL